MDLEIIDNFLPERDFSVIQSVLLGHLFPWYWNEGSVHNKNFAIKGQPQLTHLFFKDGVRSDFYDPFNPVLKKLQAVTLVKIKANLNFKTFFKRNTGYHMDTVDGDIKTAVFYINTNSGGTKFKGGKFVRSVENRVVIFDSNLFHTGVTCTKGRRVVANINFVR